MKAKFFWGITILLSMVMLFACSSELLHEQEQQKLQNSDLIKEYSTLISQNKYGLLADLALSDQPDTLPNWKDLSQGELEAVMNLLADELRFESRNFFGSKCSCQEVSQQASQSSFFWRSS